MEDQEIYEVAWEVKPKPKKPTKTQEIAVLRKTIARQRKVIGVLWQENRILKAKQNN